MLFYINYIPIAYVLIGTFLWLDIERLQKNIEHLTTRATKPLKMLSRGGKKIRLDNPPDDYDPPFTPYSVQPPTPMDVAG